MRARARAARSPAATRLLRRRDGARLIPYPPRSSLHPYQQGWCAHSVLRLRRSPSRRDSTPATGLRRGCGGARSTPGRSPRTPAAAPTSRSRARRCSCSTRPRSAPPCRSTPSDVIAMSSLLAGPHDGAAISSHRVMSWRWRRRCSPRARARALSLVVAPRARRRRETSRVLVLSPPLISRRRVFRGWWWCAVLVKQGSRVGSAAVGIAARRSPPVYTPGAASAVLFHCACVRARSMVAACARCVSRGRRHPPHHRRAPRTSPNHRAAVLITPPTNPPPPSSFSHRSLNF